MNKKSIMLEFLFWTILALIIFVPTIIFASKFFRLSDEALRSYNGLVNTINSMSNIAEMESFTLRMDKNTAIIGYSNGKPGNLVFSSVQNDKVLLESKKPAQCTEKSCICLCRKDLDVTDKNQITCYDMICKELTKHNLISKAMFFSYASEYELSSTEHGWTEETLKKDAFNNGFVIVRGGSGNKIELHLPFFVSSSKRMQVFYIQKYKNYIAVCLRTPCISDEEKFVIDGFQGGSPGEITGATRTY